ncbi:copper fist DNA binding domain-containing protein [Colletotrichum scovillei]|uniref:Copper fist DNA binding domain-containing protein n=1 Tax=Colletotrichum scovillei TaxID=1209932 RepID=A0A9P7U9G7_9PEZI|nr:copper fist DNA binding domain-containing protein [Colletotrichum scovillei]KAF4780700.1 copper fist DNA binding domain-containing protein [Colletotrichum scovillei]KAG7045505.1 copper fist DNA binding domain-containing protein [Colletotrichum scovillei]KAG7052683.1 copper fist DNA binding domain-containing protein [Colletotrichum scovillei]KAG7064958.1 copper fist DNA binding domain-containing protein [Colletotrichum scovillei]
MIIDGEKYACEACVRGHRVSNCQHSDRPLQHINKKGRPVSQCQHCRSMRKSRSAHIKCDCGEKTSKCAHLQPLADGHRETCCCNHGGRCTCSHKKEPALDTVPESDSDKEAIAPRPKPPVRRRRANTVHSDGMLTFDEHGHHKPAHKLNKASQKCGPYQLNRVNSLHSTSSLGSHSPERISDNPLKDPVSGRVAPVPQRLVKSEAASPLMRGSSGFQQLNNQLPPLDLSGIEYPTYVPNASFDLFGGSGMSSDHDAPIFSAGLSAASVDWSHIDLTDRTDKFAPSSYSQAGAQSFNGIFDFGTGSEPAPTLAATTSTSGEVSEVEDNFIAGDSDFDGFGTGSNSFIHPASFLATGADLSTIDYDSFAKSSNNKFMAAPSSFDDGGPIAGGSLTFEDDPAFWGQQFNDGIATYQESPDGLPQFQPEPWTMP